MSYNKEELITQVKDIISYSQEIPAEELSHIDDYIDVWERKKARFIERFGGLTYTVAEKCTFHLDDMVKSSKVKDFCDWVSEEIGLGDPQLAALADFVFDLGSNFYDNRMPFDYHYYNESTGEERIITKGTKIVKAFKYFISDAYMLHYLQSKASALIQENKISGKLVLSVHPLDFLSLSNNTYKWETCSHLGGDYRMGCLAYMLDDSTFICYIEGENGLKIPDFPTHIHWNSKKWRMLLHTNVEADNFICLAGKQYPFTIPGIENILLNDIQNIFNVQNITGWQNAYHVLKNDKVTDAVYNFKKINFEIREFVRTHPSAMSYNDLFFQTNGPRLYCYNAKIENLPEIIVGEGVLCPRCGKHYIKSSEVMLCEDCCKEIYTSHSLYPRMTCGICGEIIEDVNDMRRVYKQGIGFFVCPECFEERGNKNG